MVYLSTEGVFLEHVYIGYICASHVAARVRVDSCKQTPVEWNMKRGLCVQKCGEPHPPVDSVSACVSLHVSALYTTLHTGYVNSLYKTLLYIDYIYVYVKYMYIKQYTVQCAQGTCENISAWVQWRQISCKRVICAHTCTHVVSAVCLCVHTLQNNCTHVSALYMTICRILNREHICKLMF